MLELEMVVNGQLQTFQFEDGEYPVGRGPDNAVTLAVPSVSKQHAVLRVKDDQLFVKDLGSTNGTEVEGQTVGTDEMEVPAHATIRFAGIPLWRRQEEEESDGETAEFSGEEEVSSSVFYQPSEGFTENARARIVEMLSSLFELVASEADGKEVEQAACAFVAQWVDADRVILLEDDGEGTELTTKTKWMRGSQATEKGKLRLSSSIVNQVRKERTSVLVTNALNDPRFNAQQSIMALDLRSAMAAPLFDNQRVRGILYVDSSRPTVSYGTEDLQVLSATANAVAVKLRTLTLEKEIRTAARIQQALLPETVQVPDGWELDAHLVMCRQVGGDLYHCLPRPDGSTLLVLGDVAGKGIPASLAMAATLVLIRSLNDIGTPLEEMMPHLNKQLSESLAPEQFVTLFLGELHAETGRMVYSNAGHEPPLVRRASTETIDALDSTGRPVALLPWGDFGVAETIIHPGDVFAVFSDGIPEATTEGDEFFGIEPVEAAMHAHATDPLSEIRQQILDGVEDMLGAEQASDDVTLMLLRRDA